MMRLVYSNDPEKLLDELARRVRAQQFRRGVLEPVAIVVPGARVDSYVRAGIAERSGIAANLRVGTLASAAAEWVEIACGAIVADRSSYEEMALAVLVDDAVLAAPGFEPVRAYIHACGDSREAADLRRVQLAARIGALFADYAVTRADLIHRWSSPRRADESHDEEATERWQRHLWTAMWARRRPPVQLPLSEAVARWPSPGSPALAALPAEIHIFTPGHLGPVHRQVLERLAGSIEVHGYALSPCEGLWEEAEAGDPALLVAWGRPGRETARVTNALSRFDHDDRFADPLEEQRGGHTLLRQVQSDILHRRTGELAADVRRGFARDDSVVVLEHASIRRELEAVASEVWRLLEADATLRFADVAVVVPDADVGLYEAQLPSVFREAHDLPCQLSGASVFASVSDAALSLLALPTGRFTRAEVLRVASHPLVRGEQGGDPDRWAAWCASLGIVHGANRTAHEGTYVSRDILSWDQGLKRLALGAFMSASRAGEPGEGPFRSGDESYLPLEIEPSEIDVAAEFGLLLRSLVEDARFAAGAELTLAEWSQWMRAVVEAYVVAETPVVEEALVRVLRGLHGVGAVDIGPRAVGYRMALELARRKLGSESTSAHGDGVVLASLGALRAVPFRVVFACGLSQGRFPAPDPDDPLDLKRANPRPTDVSPREHDRYAFFERLFTTRDRFAISYVSRDPLTGQPMSPASVVQELESELAARYVDDVRSLRRRHALRRWDPTYFPDLFAADRHSEVRFAPEAPRVPEARAEARTLALRHAAERHGSRPSLDDVALRATSDPAWAALARHLRLTSTEAASARRGEGRLRVSPYALAKFLEFPLQAWARFRLGLDEREDADEAFRENEPFETVSRDETLLLRRIFLDATRSGAPLGAAYDEAVRLRELEGAGPSGAFARGERAEHMRVLETWAAALDSTGLAAGELRVHHFGRGSSHRTADRVHDALVVDVDLVEAGVTRIVQVELAGGTLPVSADGRASVTLVKQPEPSGAWPRASRRRPDLRALVDGAMLAASGVVGPGPHESILVPPDKETAARTTFGATDSGEALVWLRGLVRDLLSGPHAYFLPCEAVFRAEADPSVSLGRWLEDARTSVRAERSPLRSVYGPVPHAGDYPIPDEETAAAMVARRFEPMLRESKR